MRVIKVFDKGQSFVMFVGFRYYNFYLTCKLSIIILGINSYVYETVFIHFFVCDLSLAYFCFRRVNGSCGDK